MIEQVHVRNFKSLGDVTLSLARPTVLVGRNGAGKSTCIDVLRFVRDALGDGLDRALTMRQGIEAVRRYSPTRPFQVEIALVFSSGSRYELVLSASGGNVVVKREYFRGKEKGSNGEFFEVLNGELKDGSGMFARLPRIRVGEKNELFLYRLSFPERNELRRMAFCEIYPNTLRLPQQAADSTRLLDDGSNLASVLQKMSAARHEEVRSTLQHVASDVEDFSIQRVGSWLSIALHHTDASGRHIERDAVQESDGTLRALGLATALTVPATRTQLITVEEPELGLHPGAVAALWSLIETVSQTRTVIVTTHSPDLISRVPVGNLRVVRMESGVTTVGPLAKHQVQAVQQELFTTGDLLRIQGLEREDLAASDTANA